MKTSIIMPSATYKLPFGISKIQSTNWRTHVKFTKYSFIHHDKRTIGHNQFFNQKATEVNCCWMIDESKITLQFSMALWFVLCYNFDLSWMLRAKITDGARLNGVAWMGRQFLMIRFVWSIEFRSRKTQTFQWNKFKSIWIFILMEIWTLNSNLLLRYKNWRTINNPCNTFIIRRCCQWSTICEVVFVQHLQWQPL